MLLIGSDEAVDRVLSRVFRHPELGLDPDRVDLHLARLLRGARARRERGAPGGLGDRVLGQPHPEEVKELIEEVGICRVIVTGWSESVTERTELMRVLSECGVCIDYVSGEPEALYSTAVLHHIEGLPILTIRPTGTRVHESLKRAVDITASAAGLAILSPLLAFVALRIRLDSPGPILFRQPRAGIDGDEFELLKFRTMVDGADQMRDDAAGRRRSASRRGRCSSFATTRGSPRSAPRCAAGRSTSCRSSGTSCAAT